MILWWKVNYPGVDILLAKLDVDSAFKLLWVAAEDACYFATELPGNPLQLDHMVLVLYLSLTFGWGGSPGNYTAFSRLRVQLYKAATPPLPLWHADVPYHDKTLVDDTVLVEPRLGIRPSMSAWWAETTLKQVFGPSAINEAKRGEEGTFDTTAVIWGSPMTPALTPSLTRSQRSPSSGTSSTTPSWTRGAGKCRLRQFSAPAGPYSPPA